MISDILRKIEWSSEWCGNYYCPICKRNKEDGHTDECELKRFIVDADTSDSRKERSLCVLFVHAE